MEYMLAPLVPLVLIGLGLATVAGKSLTPAAVTGRFVSLLRSLVRWLWRERHPRSGAGRLNQPRIWYRPQEEDDE